MTNRSNDYSSLESKDFPKHFSENIDKIWQMERSNIINEYQVLEARTSKNILATSIMNSQVAKSSMGDTKKRRGCRGSGKKMPKEVPDKVTTDKPTPKTSKFHVLQSGSQKTSKTWRPSTSKAVEHLPTPSKQKNVLKNKTNQVEIKYSFTIKPVECPETGRFLRKQNSKYKYINLKSFLSNTNTTPCVFVSDTSSVKLVNSFNKLSIHDKKDMTKSKRRKFSFNASPVPKTSVDIFEDHITSDAAKEGLENGELVKGFIRVNPKNFKDAYVSNENTSLTDYYITSVADRNRAFDGDEVVLRIKPEEQWIDGKKTATVVHILKPIHTRVSIGKLIPVLKKKCEYALFQSRDKRLPLLRIPTVSWPNGFQANPKQFENILFVAKIVDWRVPSFAMGVLMEVLGAVGDLAVETVSILREFDLDVTPYGPEIMEYLPVSEEIPVEEFKYRRDIREECVFTIDPATARDLDDAVSVREMPNGNYEIGVHIADASFYFEEGTELDQIVGKKATTIYLVQRAYHMLPVELCLFCSLLPGQDRLSFSVFWEMTPDGEILSKSFARTIMNSCTQLAYEHAQAVIENPDREFTEDDFPQIHSGFKPSDIKKTVTILQNIAVKLRENRMRNGSLKIDQVKLSFNLDPKTGEPLEFWKYENKESHRLIEEFMLLANISVAERINEDFPDIAFLRCHEPPKQTMLVELQNNLATCGLHIDISSSAGISNSLNKYVSEDYAGQCRAAVLNHITAKAMTRARYFCGSTAESDSDFNHYALSIPIYTHFTSPIRRYSDIMVHRLLAASLGYREKPQWDVDYVTAIAANCNAQKYNAKRAGEASCDLYLAHYVEQHQPCVQDCVVVDVKDRSFDVIVLETGSVIRIYQNTCEPGTTWQKEVIPNVKTKVDANDEEKLKEESEKKLYRLKITFPKTRHLQETVLVVELFTSVKVTLNRQSSYKLEGRLVRPIATQVFVGQVA